MHLVCGVCAWAGTVPARDAPFITWCPICSTGLTVPPPQRDIRSDGVWSTSSYRDRLSDREQWRREAEARVTWLMTVVPPPGPVLEVGSGTGEFVEAAEAAGYDVVGVEPSEWAAHHAADLSARVFCGDLTSYKATGGRSDFAAVVMFHVLEHVPEPVDLLREVRGILQTTGVLLIEVPNGGALPTDDDGTTWWMRSLQDHIHHFRPGSLERLLQTAGYAPATSQWTMQDAYGAGASKRDRVREMVRSRSLRSRRDLLRAVARA